MRILSLLSLALGCLVLVNQTAGQYRSASSPQVIASPCPQALRINTNYEYRKSLHLICLQHDKIEVFNYFERVPLFSEQLLEIGANQLASFVDGEGALHILLGYPFKKNGTSMYSIDATGRYLAEKHTINTQYVTAMSIWRLQLNYNWLLAIANHPTYEYLAFDQPTRPNQQQRTTNNANNLNNLTPMISIHSWRSSYFDSLQVIKLPHSGRVNKIEPININGMEFLVVAMEPDQYHNGIRGRYEQTADSIVYRLDFGDGELNWSRFQSLNMKRALDLKSFIISNQNSLQQGYYMAALGQSNEQQVAGREIDTINLQGPNMNDEQYGLIIFKFLGDRFLHSHFHPVAGATKLDAITYGVGDSYVIIALLSEWSKQVSLFVFDGLTLRPMKSPIPSSQIGMNPKQLHYSRRSLGSDNLHLFLAPQYPDRDFSNQTTAAKRDQVEPVDNQLLFSIPVLSGPSSPPNSPSSTKDSTSALHTQETGVSLYKIPIDNLTGEEESSGGEPSTMVGYGKRTLNTTNHQNLYNWCRQTTDQLLVDDFDAAAKRLLSLPRVNQATPIELNGDLIIDDNLLVNNLLYANKFQEINNNEQTTIIQEMPSNISDTFKQIKQAHLEIDGVRRLVDQILVDDGTDQNIFNTIAFDTMVIECLDQAHINPRVHNIPFLAPVCPHIDELNTVILNNRNISDIRTQALLTARSMTITRDVRFEHLVLRGSSDILGLLNNLRVMDIVFRKGPSYGPIIGHKFFKNGVYSDSKLIVNTWNGVHVDRINYLTATGDQRIDAPIHFDHIILDSNQDVHVHNVSSRIEVINGIHLDRHLSQMAQSNINNNFDVPIQIDELVLNGPIQLTDRSLISSVDLENSWYNTMFKHSNQNITAPMEFSDVYVSYGGDILVNGLINRVEFKPDLVLMRNRDISLPNPIVFDRDVYMENLILRRQLNGIQVVINPETSRYELAILYDGGVQILTGDKILGEVKLGGQSHFGGNINGRLNLTQLYHLANNNGAPHRFDLIRLAGNNIRFSNNAHVHIESTINGILTNQICSIAREAAKSQIKQYKRLKFEDPVYFKSLRCASINGFTSLTNSFLTRFGDQRIAGTIRLTGGLILNTTVHISSSLNSLNIKPLASAIASVINETLTGHKIVYGDMSLDHIATPKINNLALANIFESRSDTPQHIRAPMIFDHLDIENVVNIEGNLETRQFNAINISDLLANTLQYDTPQVIYNHIELNTLQLLANTNLVTNSFNGHNLRRLFADAVLKDAPQQILAPKTFTGSVEFNDKLLTRHGIDGLTENELRFNMLLHTDELIEGDLIFNNDIVIKKELEIQSGVINDIDLNTFVDSMLYENRPDKKSFRIVGNGSVRFKDVQLNNLLVAGTIQGIDLSRDALQKEHLNSTYRQHLRNQQIRLNNDRLLNLIYESGLPFRVNGVYRDSRYQGSCFVHSCDRSTANPAHMRPMTAGFYGGINPISTLPMMPVTQSWTRAPYQQNYHSTPNLPPKSQSLPPPPPPPPIPVTYMKQLYPNVMPQPNAFHNKTTYWRPHWEHLVQQPTYINNNNRSHSFIIDYQQPIVQPGSGVLVDPRLVEHQARIKAQALQELGLRINKYLSISFYYQIAQNQPMGPILGTAPNPIERDTGCPLLLVKGTSKPGEPCLSIGQTIDIMFKQRTEEYGRLFTQTTILSETSNPIFVESLVVGQNHYLFILDSYVVPDSSSSSSSYHSSMMKSQIIVYLWDQKSGMYQLRERLPLDGQPSSMKAFTYQNKACISTSNPHIVYGNKSGMPIFYCQETPTSRVNLRYIFPITSVFELDIITNVHSADILVAALSQKDSELTGALTISSYNMYTGKLDPISLKRMVRPLKLHFIMRPQATSPLIQLAVSHAITANNDDNHQALTQIFSLRTLATPPNAYGPGIGIWSSNSSRFYESQLFRDSQFYDIQSVMLDNMNSMLFLQSAHSISIYAPNQPETGNRLECDPHYTLVNRLASKGANKFQVFNAEPINIPKPFGVNNQTNINKPYNHFLVLSRDQCEQHRYSTSILKSNFY